MRNEDQKLAGIENEGVINLLTNLQRVEAPGDFDFHVKARIAQGRPAGRNASLIPSWLRVAVPLVLLLFVGGYFGLRKLNSSGGYIQTAEPLAQVQQIGTAPVSEMPSTQLSEASANKVVVAQVSAKPSNTFEKPVAVSPERLVARTGSSNKKTGGGSIDFGQREGKTKSLRKPKDIVSPGGLPAKDMLTQMGIDANYSGSWKVGNVKQNSIGERSGVKSGDVIEAINDENLTEKTTLASPFSGKNIRVRRDGKSVQIDLKP